MSGGDYQLVIDNLLDLTHVGFMHPFLAQDGPVTLSYKAKKRCDPCCSTLTMRRSGHAES